MHNRHVAKQLQSALADTPVVVINGARQSGKSTLAQLQSTTNGLARRYLTLDDAVVLNAAKSDPSGFIGALDGPITIDEIQRAPSRLTALRSTEPIPCLTAIGRH